MHTQPLTPETICRSVWAVPPLARTADGELDRTSNETLVRHIEAGGLTTLLYGGNALFYHLTAGEFDAAVTLIEEIAADDTLVIPAIGPTFGLLRDQADRLKSTAFPAAMILPSRDIVTSAGIARGVREASDRMGKPVVLYIKYGGLLAADDVRAMVEDGTVAAIKYAVVLDDPTDDPELAALCDAVDPQIILSGMGEQPAVPHREHFKLGNFTTGCGCLFPSLTTQLQDRMNAGHFDDTTHAMKEAFLPLESLRDNHGPISVLHRAVEHGLTPTGPILPLLSAPDDELDGRIAASLDQVRSAASAWLS